MRLLADENFHGDMLRGLLRIEPKLDIVRVQDTELYQAADPVVFGMGGGRRSNFVDA